MYENSKVPADSEDRMLEWAQSYLDLHKDVEKDYTGKYEKDKASILTPQKSVEEVPKPVAGFGEV
jgi:hypothetical protein